MLNWRRLPPTRWFRCGDDVLIARPPAGPFSGRWRGLPRERASCPFVSDSTSTRNAVVVLSPGQFRADQLGSDPRECYTAAAVAHGSVEPRMPGDRSDERKSGFCNAECAGPGECNLQSGEWKQGFGLGEDLFCLLRKQGVAPSLVDKRFVLTAADYPVVARAPRYGSEASQMSGRSDGRRPGSGGVAMASVETTLWRVVGTTLTNS